LTSLCQSGRGARTQVILSQTPVLIQEVGILILIRILFATQPTNRILKKPVNMVD